MPNWCTNIVRADKKVLDYVKSDKGDFDFEKIAPIPEDLKDIPLDKFVPEIFRKYDICSPYDWCMKNWGTGHNVAKNSKRTKDNETLFYSSWNETTEAIEKLSRIFPEEEIIYIYYEHGAHFAGYDVFKDGLSIWGGDLEWILQNPYEEDDNDYPVFREIHINAPYEEYIIVESQSGNKPVYEIRENSIKIIEQ